MGQRKRNPTTVDHLADLLSQKTGTRFQVLRGYVPKDTRRPYSNRNRAMRYGLQATRNNVTYQFQRGSPMTLDEVRRWLASIIDMCAMNFIPLDPYLRGSDPGPRVPMPPPERGGDFAPFI